MVTVFMKSNGRTSQAVTAQISTKKAIFLKLGEAMMEGPGINQAYPCSCAGSMTLAEGPGKKDVHGQNKQDRVDQDEGKVGPTVETPETAAGRVDAPGERQGDKRDEPGEQQRED